MTSSYQFTTSYELWAAALASSASIGLTSLVPWVFNMQFTDDNGISTNDKTHAGNNSKGPQNRRLKLMLSFAVGSILGDIFLHLIPESINSQLIESPNNDHAYKKVGLSIISGVLMFIIVEKLIENWLTEIMTDTTIGKDIEISASSAYNEQLLSTINDKSHPSSDLTINNKIPTKDKTKKIIITTTTTTTTDYNNNNINNNNIGNNNNINRNTNICSKDGVNNNHNHALTYRPNGIIEKKGEKKKIITIACRDKTTTQKQQKSATTTTITTNNIVEVDKIHVIETAGYLNLIANGFDNFTHGLAVGASFLVGFKVGLLTTFVIIIHEIPHEICDYAILVKSGFNRWDAVRAQSSTAIFGILGTVTALSVKSVQALSTQTGWILPFSSGGFLYIALVNILPELLDDRTSSRDSFDQIVCILFGILFMAVVAIL